MKVTPIVPISALRNQKQQKRPSKDDYKKLAQSRPPDGVA